VGGADQAPPSLNLFQPTEQELPEAHGLFDLAKYGFDNLLS
jgi:hypothetical protein